MKLNHDVVTTPPLPAATVMLLRDAADGLEVFMVRRHGLSDVLGGAYVFPGGKLDANDAELDMDAHVKKLFELLGTPADKAAKDAADVLDLETSLAKPALTRSGYAPLPRPT